MNKETCNRCKGTGIVNIHNPLPGHMAYCPMPCPDCQRKESSSGLDILTGRIKKFQFEVEK